MSALAVMCACNSKLTNEYTINGTTDLADGEFVKMMYYVGKDSNFVDSVAVANGAFTFNGTVDRPYTAMIIAGTDMMQAYQNGKMRNFIIEPGELTVELKGDSYKDATVAGSALTAEMDSMNAVQQAIYDKMTPLREQYRAAKSEATPDTAVINKLETEMEALFGEVKEVNKNYLKTHTNSLYAPFVMNNSRSDLSLDELKEIYNSWSPEVQAMDTETATYIKALESIAPGAVAPEITGKDQNDKDVTLSGLKGKVVLLDFWATWCGPCRASLPHVKEIYEKYNDKGLAVLAVSLDRDTEAWKKFINEQKSGLELYANIYDEGGKNADNYAIQYIPSKFLIDADGKMIGRFDDEKELDAKLAEIFAGK